MRHIGLSLKSFPLKDKDVHIWTANLLSNEYDLSYFRALFSEDELQRANSFKFAQHQNNYTISRGILRCLLGIYLGEKPQDIQIHYGLWGKPCLANEQSLFFNLSHSKHYAVYAFSSSQAIGIDIENIESEIEIESMVMHILSSPHELAYWACVRDQEKVSEFYKLWVCKEAFLKASGKGWLDKENALPVSMLEALKEGKNNPYIFESQPGYVGALYMEDNSFTPMHFVWDQNFIETKVI